MKELCARLLHDIGKYIARTARNLPKAASSKVDAALLAMLIRDLYGDGKHQSRPAVRFEKLLAENESAQTNEPLKKVRELLGKIDADEPAVRKGELAAVTRAKDAAIEIEATLRALARSVR